MHVLHVIPSLDKRDGGPSIALPLMARSLAQQGIEVEVVATMSAEDARAQGVTFGEPLKRDGFTVRFFKRQTNFYKASLPMLRWLWSHVRNYDLLHIHALFSFTPLAAAFVARRHRIPYVMRPLGLLNRWGMENRRRWIKALSFRLLDRPALEAAAAIHYTSAGEEREAARLGLRTRSAVAPLGTDLEPFRHLPDSEVFFQRFPEARGRKLILFLSRLDLKKGLELLLDSMALAADAGETLVIAGSGDPLYEAWLRNRAAELGITSRVLWTGFLDGADKLAAFAAADVFVLPSRSENFGIALLEAMAAGLPCVSSDQVALALDAGEAGAVRVVPCSAESIRSTLLDLLSNEEERAELGRRARALAESRYSLKAMGESLATLYREVLA